MKPRWAIAAATIVGIYIISYCVNSALGGFWMKPVADGKDKYASGLSIPTAVIWQPRIGYATPFQKDGLGFFYLPLIACDRTWIHPTKYLSDPKDEQWLFSSEAAKLAHPKTK